MASLPCVPTGVVPTHVGVNRPLMVAPDGIESRPHTRGGEPKTTFGVARPVTSSPHTWG